MTSGLAVTPERLDVAGKKIASKKKVEANAPQSKTARASMAKGKGKVEGFIPAAPEHMNRVVSLNGGKGVYVMDPRNGHTVRLVVGSIQYNEFLAVLLADPKYGDQIRTELVTQNFPFTLAEELEDAL